MAVLLHGKRDFFLKDKLSDQGFRTRLRARLEPDTWKHCWFLFLAALLVVCFWTDLHALIRFSFGQDEYSHVILIPTISLALILRRSKVVFARARWSIVPGLGLMLFGAGAGILQKGYYPADSMASLTVSTACFVFLLAGVFTLCYGRRAVWAARFSLLFLMLMVPIPERVLAAATLLLEKASCQLTYFLMASAGTPVFQNSFFLSTPSGTIEVARQCSGINSTLGLLIGSLVAGHLFLQSVWRRTALALTVVPVSIFKNALRIVSLYWLGTHTDQHFLTGELHHYGGIPFSAVAVGLLGPLVWALRKPESPEPNSR